MSTSNIKKTSKIEIHVGLNENSIPKRMMWTAEDAEIKDKEAKAMFLSLWDAKDQNTLKMDLWVEEMSVEEMKQFMHQTLLSLADNFEKATGEKNISEDLRDYCYHFAEKMRILPEEN
jgi:gliding motility-associated protein GldC